MLVGRTIFTYLKLKEMISRHVISFHDPGSKHQARVTNVVTVTLPLLHCSRAVASSVWIVTDFRITWSGRQFFRIV